MSQKSKKGEQINVVLRCRLVKQVLIKIWFFNFYVFNNRNLKIIKIKKLLTFFRPMTKSEKVKTRKVVNCNPNSKEVSIIMSSASGNSSQHTRTYNFDKVCFNFVNFLVFNLIF